MRRKKGVEIRFRKTNGGTITRTSNAIFQMFDRLKSAVFCNFLAGGKRYRDNIAIVISDRLIGK